METKPAEATRGSTEIWTTGIPDPRVITRHAQAAEAAGWDGFAVVDSQNLTADCWVGLALAAMIVIVFVGFFEEILFRGLIQSAGTLLFARGGILLSVTATAIMYAASLNLRYVIFMALVAVFLGVVARRSGSIAAPIAAHAALATVQLVLMPIVLP